MSSSKDKSFFSLYITSKDGLETAALVLVFDIRIPDQHWLLGPECKSSSGSYTLYLQFLTKIEKIDHKEDNWHCLFEGLRKT